MTITKRDPYPLQWPEGWKRTTLRDRPKFSGRFALDRDEVIRRLARGRRATNVVITDVHAPEAELARAALWSLDSEERQRALGILESLDRDRYRIAWAEAEALLRTGWVPQ